MTDPRRSESASDSDIASPLQSRENGSLAPSTCNNSTSPSRSARADQSSSPRCSSSNLLLNNNPLPKAKPQRKAANRPPGPSSTSRIPISQIATPDPTNGRAEIDSEAIQQLASSIAAIGLINPITVRPTQTGYILIAGNRRLTAMQRLNAKYIDATVLNVDNLTSATITLTENVSRSNLTPVEEACQLHNLVENHPNGVEGVATTLSRSPNWILDRLDILAWPESLRTSVHERKISLAAAKRLAKIQPDKLREERIYQAATHGINTRTAALWLQDAIAAATPPAPVSQITGQIDNNTYVTETAVSCWLCRTLAKLETTRTLRICEPCITNVESQLQAQASPLQHPAPTP